MSEIIKIEDPPVLRFGKHKGRSAAEVLARDPEYVEWVLAQPWFQEKNPQLVQFFVTGGSGEPSETPEHNALQAKFAQDAYCLAAAAMFSAGQRLRTASDVQQETQVAAGPMLASLVRSSHPAIENRSFEVNAWDVQFTFYGASSQMDTSSEPDCTCTPLPLPDEPDKPKFPHSAGDHAVFMEAREEFYRLESAYTQVRDSRLKVSTINKCRTESRHRPRLDHTSSYNDRWYQASFNAYTEATKHEIACPRSSMVYFKAWSLGDDDIVESTSSRFALELKPTMGDDFPAVLRQVLGYVSRAVARREHIVAAVVVGEFRSAAVPWSVVKKQFWESGVLLIREAELDALVEKHAYEWGASTVDQDADFTVNFINQL
jgi:hypothetical protein